MNEENDDKFCDSGMKNHDTLFGFVTEEKPSLWKRFTDTAFWKQFFIAIFTSVGAVGFIPSVFADQEELAAARAKGRTRNMESIVVSVFLHIAVFLAIFFISRLPSSSAINPDDVVFVNNPIFLPYEIESDGRDGGGGGGGGKKQPDPPASGELPEMKPVQMIAPDPTTPQPLMAAEDLLAMVPSIEMPIELPRDLSMSIGDIFAPPNSSTSSGSGTGGGLGTGTGTGVGSGKGAGAGPGSGGGFGGGDGGGIGDGTGKGIAGSYVEPKVLVDTRPEYTEEARKAKITGNVLLTVTIRKDGTVDNIRIARSLGHGLDESAIRTVASKWRFKPATRNGVPIDLPDALIEVKFNLY